MEENNNFGQQWQTPQNQNADNSNRSQFLGTGEGEIPLAKMPSEKIDVRTMASDVTSMQETGGGIPRPYSPQPQESAPGQENTPPAPPMSSQAPVNFVDQMVGGTMQTMQKAQNTQQTSVPSKKGGAGLFKGILVAIIVIGLIAIGYFFVYPMFSVKNATVNTEATNSETPKQPAEEIVVPVVPPAEPATTTEPTIPTPPPAPVSTIEVHSSFLKTRADLVFDAKLSAFTLDDLKNPIAFNTTSVPLFKEVVWKTEENKPLSFTQVASLIFPTFFTQEKVASFQDDFTLFAYSNSKGTWLGFIAKLKDGIDVGKIQDGMSVLQKDTGLKNIFLSDPGTMSPWKDGKVRNKPTSLAQFSLSGATISYTWFDRYLLVSSNIDAADEAGKRLGY